MNEAKERPILAFDTSTACLAGAVWDGNKVLSEVQSHAERNHSVQIVTKLQELLKESGVNREELAGIAVGKGPGSYTGVRIAVSAAKTLAWAWRLPLVGVSSLEAIAFGALHRGEAASLAGADGHDWVLPIMDARRGQVYTGHYAHSAASGWTCCVPDGIRLMRDWVDEIAAKAAEAEGLVRTIRIAGDLSQHEGEAVRLKELCAPSGVQVELQPYDMEGRWLARLAYDRLSAGESDDVHTFVPNYTQLVEAEAKLLAKQRSEAGER
ncbi:tRNA (adenosine(37)-N6)-threonylcarbamoyltransferase complex dimerization subunit type 1 TsaB [Paenibacillus thailandensis]|uniref:tRNA (Adenosine(37)-N6)-threonylcarbamoyltransferase complex dimerization subunit type 1 TsaB n=1 Tax=Paenibacillus thailandensis TaxID=393250 RepID=A0ABW5QVK3_9BACL